MLIQADARHIPLVDGCVQTVVTSPPYFGLRDYGTATWVGGDPSCEHKQGRPGAGRADGVVDDRAQRNRDGVGAMGGDCRQCGAQRVDSQIGLEPTPDAYVAQIVAVFREVRRVCRDDATIWLNLGDSYASGGRKTRDPGQSKIHPAFEDDAYADGLRPNDPDGIKPKDLLGIPWRVAFALQSDGWYLRSDIIWHKPNPMPESVTDRPTKSHEYLFLLSKSERYFYDADAIKEGSQVYHRKGTAGGHHLTKQDGYKGIAGGTLKRDPDEAYGFARDITTVGRNRRSVWTVPTIPYSGAHFATMPEKLVEPCILAGTSAQGCCVQCGAPRERIVEKETVRDYGGTREIAKTPLNVIRAGWREGGPETVTVGWRGTCACGATNRPCLVLDPFMGSGTVGAVAERLGRRWVGCDLAYQDLAKKRTVQQGLRF